MRIKVGLLPLLALAALAACTKPDSYYITGDAASREELGELFSLLSAKSGDADGRFSLVKRIGERLYSADEGRKLAVFLTTHLRREPDDPYGAYYLLVVAKHYLGEGARPLAAMYLGRAVREYRDLEVDGESVHFTALSSLAEIVDDPAGKVEYYKQLLGRFPTKTNPGVAYYLLGRAYEQLGEWSLAMDSYAKYNQNPSPVPGHPEATGYARKTVVFNSSDKSWTYESLDALVAGVKAALARASGPELRSFTAKVNFFTISWEQDESETYTSTKDETSSQFSFENFMKGGRIQCADRLDKSSNANEALLRTWGWSDYKIATWYFSFRKVDFPADPEVHGRWEWAGIYFGDKE